MGYNRENYRRIKQEFSEKNLHAKQDAQRRREMLWMMLPEIRVIDGELDAMGLHVLEAATKSHGSDLQKEIDRLQKKCEKLTKKRAALLTEKGYPADYSDVRYECDICSDTGFDGLKICHCMREKLVLAGYESSGIANLIRTKTFESFDPAYPKNDAKAIENNRMVFRSCRNYAENFDTENAASLLMIGGTGLGKTHLSAAIAGEVIRRGYDVVCETAQNFFGDFEQERFRRNENADLSGERKTDRYFECDLLIIDDLGTEMSNSFTLSCLYNILNTRMNRGRPMIINTNLTKDGLCKRYDARIASRLFGEFRPMLFMGTDMRQEKLS